MQDHNFTTEEMFSIIDLRAIQTDVVIREIPGTSPPSLSHSIRLLSPERRPRFTG